MAIQTESYKICPGNDPASLRRINEQNAQFWDKERRLMVQRTSDEAILAIAVNDVRSDYERMTPLAWQISFAQALARADEAVRLARRDFSRRGGKAHKSDALQKLIEEIVRENPNITERELFHTLNKQVAGGVIESIDSESSMRAGDRRNVHFYDCDERLKTASVKGLKDRLFRAKNIRANR
jgi:hypothetical protein